MSECAKQTFLNVTPERFAALVQKAAEADISISGDSGTMVTHGLTLAWTFHRDSGTLEIQCTSHPVLISCGTINHKIHDLMDSPA